MLRKRQAVVQKCDSFLVPKGRPEVLDGRIPASTLNLGTVDVFGFPPAPKLGSELGAMGATVMCSTFSIGEIPHRLAWTRQLIGQSSFEVQACWISACGLLDVQDALVGLRLSTDPRLAVVYPAMGLLESSTHPLMHWGHTKQ